MNIAKKTVFIGANVVTMSDDLPKAEAVCVSNGRIDCVGSKEDVLRYAGFGKYDLVDLGGGTLYPGFIDTHSHLSTYSACLDQVYCGRSCGNVAGVLEALKKGKPSSGDWILGYGFDDTGLPDNRHLLRKELDEVCPDLPMMVVHSSIHTGYVNTKALERLGYTGGTRISGGEICLDESGEPNGILFENALFNALAMIPPSSPAETKENLVRAMAVYNQQGFTTFQDGGLGLYGDARAFLASYVELAGENRMSARGYIQFLPVEIDKLLERGILGIGTDYLKLGGVKFFTDGSIQITTAALLEDYYCMPGHKSGLVWDLEELAENIVKYHCKGIQIAIHANGDAAVEAVLYCFEKAVKACPRTDLRHMIVHAQLASEEQLIRCYKLGIIPTLFARHVENWGDRHRNIFLGPERAARMDACGSCVKNGIPFALHVDSPVLPVTALGSMHAAVNRVTDDGFLLGPDQRISPLEAIKAYTKYASLTCGGEFDRGVIEPGRFADFVLLDADLEAIDPSEIRNTKVVRTICGGKTVYEA